MTSKQNNLKPPEVYINYVRPEYDSMRRVTSSQECVDIIRAVYNDFRINYKECCWVVLLNASNCVLGISKISEGSDKKTVVSNKEILQLAILSHATGIILVHNHPSGSTDVSREDTILTKRLRLSLELFQMELVDHIIITKEEYLSMADEDLII